MKPKLKDTKGKSVALAYSRPVWTTYPSTIQLLQLERGKFAVEKDDVPSQQKNKGINATIILLSAAYLEGFLVDCLLSFVQKNVFSNDDTMDGRLEREFLNRIQSATFSDFPDLFRLTLGDKIRDLLGGTIQGDDLLTGIYALISYRNGLAHARSAQYNFFESASGDAPFELDRQYKEIHCYLGKKKLIKGQDEMLCDSVADHFAKLVEPYVKEVLSLLPVPQSDTVKSLVTFSLTGKIA